MTEVLGIRFESTGKIYYFSPSGLGLNLKDWVVVETSQGLSLGQVVIPSRLIPEQQLPEPPKPVLRLATSHDLLLRGYYQAHEARALERCREKVAEAGLEMQVVKARYSFGGDCITFYFTSDRRIDFRALVRDLANMFHTSVDLRQLGPRDELRLLKGWGSCGRPLCCATWMTEFRPISIRMAKAQDLPLSPDSISGDCGRLCCCLSFEYDQYHHHKQRSVSGEELEGEERSPGAADEAGK